MIFKSVFLLGFISSILANERALVDTMIHRAEGEISDTMKQTLRGLASLPTGEKNSVPRYCGANIVLYEAYPNLKETLPHVSLADLPTPVARLSCLESHGKGHVELYVKRDDVTGRLKDDKRSFGGNKIRKQEFLLADALSLGAKSVITYGAIGSNHVVATAVSCKSVGLRCAAMLIPQDIEDIVKRNLLLMHKYDVEMTLNPDLETRHMQTICSFVQNKYKRGDMPYFIPTGGSCPIGIIGFVNAAFELRAQIEQGLLPEPDYIYVAMGSVGTMVGLMLGVRAARLKSKVVGVAVEPENPRTFGKHIVNLLNKTNALLHEKDDSFPLFAWSENDLNRRFEFSGPDYGVVTKEAVRAIDVMKKTEGIQLDTTYTGKAFSGMLHDLESGALNGKKVLFWNTFCSDAQPVDFDYKGLPIEFHCYFQ